MFVCLNREFFVGSSFLIQSESLCLFIGFFRPFIFNVIIDIIRLKLTTLLFNFYLFHMFLIILSSFSDLFWANLVFFSDSTLSALLTY